ncbi:MAG: acyclic terpene utilization AtuA family protein [Planctomycetaceae bacterium]|nr:acyclic terpene utilization AtuA family protein [Planctomycetaceae bacterium]
MSRTIRVGNGAGFWGDNLDAPRLLAEAGRLDYLTLEYLAELTLSILAHQKSRNPCTGFVTDFPVVLKSLLPCLKQQPQLRIVTNGGGMNPTACAQSAAAILAEAGLPDLRVAAVSGDDIFPKLDELTASGEQFLHFDSGKPLGDLRAQLASANVYLGAGGIVDALEQGARIVVTGRVADASLTVGPAVHEFGWSWNDWPRLAQASVAGHLIECGAQATGGMYSAWTPEIALANVGYPIAEFDANGRVVISKPEATDGLVSPDTLAEQLIYEIGDPQHYLTPDADADFSQVKFQQLGPNQVEVSGAAAGPPPETYKVSMAYRDGYMAAGTLVLYGPEAAARARACGEIVLQRVRRAGFNLARTNIECLGAGQVLPGITPLNEEAPEVLLRVTVHDPSREAVERFTREFSPLVGSGLPGVTGYTGPRAKPWPVLAYWPTKIHRSHVQANVVVHSAREWLS